MGPGNTSVSQAAPSLPVVAPIANSAQRGGAIARRMKSSSKRAAMDAGRLSNVPDDKTSFEGI